MVDLNVNLCLTTFGEWRSTGKKSKVNKQNLLESKGQRGVSRQVYLLCRWKRHLTEFPHLGVVDRWPATPKRARRAH